MTIGAFLTTTTAQLKKAGIESARLDTLILLEDELKQDRTSLLAHLEAEIPTHLLADLRKKYTQRKHHTPLAYIRGKVMFYGREFRINEHVLVPRPETEAMIDMLKKWVPKRTILIADIGTGSGCIGITAALELPHAVVDLYDIDKQALSIARLNAKSLKVHVTCHEEDLLPNKAPNYDVILANLPYIPKHMSINRAAMHEPAHAIFSGSAGLDHYKRLWMLLASRADKPKLIVTESLPEQHNINTRLAQSAGYKLIASEGFAQSFNHTL
jgi:release factor glutamine methyltransferase